MIRWRKLIEALWKALRYLEISSPLGRRRVHIRAVGLSTIRRMPVTISHIARSTKLVGGVPQEKSTIARTPKKPRNTMVNYEVMIS
jgi:hypothetical protein